MVVDGRTLAALTLYILARLAERGKLLVEEERLVKLLFLSLYADVEDDRLVLARDPPRIAAYINVGGKKVRVGFRVYLRGPFIPPKRLVALLEAYGKELVGVAKPVRRVRIMEPRIGLVPELLGASRVRALVFKLGNLLSERLGRRMRVVDTVIDRLGLAPLGNVTGESLRILRLDDIARKAIAYNVDLEVYVDYVHLASRLSEAVERGELPLDALSDDELDEVRRLLED